MHYPSSVYFNFEHYNTCMNSNDNNKVSLSLFTISPPGFSISVVEEDGVQQLYITDVKAGGLAFAKGLLPSSLSSSPHRIRVSS